MLMRKFPADSIFEETTYLFCEDFEEGFRLFTSWFEFIQLCKTKLTTEDIPRVVYFAQLQNGCAFVSSDNVIIVPWKELITYI